MYVYRNSVARSRNQLPWKHKPAFPFIVYVHMSLPKIRNTLGPLCKVSDSLFDLNQILSFSTDFRGSPQYQVWQKFVHWEPRCYMRTDGHDEATSRFSRLCVRALYKNTEGRHDQLHSRLRPSGERRRCILLMNTTASEEYCASIVRDQGTKRCYMRNFSVTISVEQN